jgi:hypothetical protein
MGWGMTGFIWFIFRQVGRLENTVINFRAQ